MCEIIDRLFHLFRGIQAHLESVAEEYVKACETYTTKFVENGLVNRGIERSLLQLVYDVGKGDAIPELILVSTDKREYLRTLDTRSQAEFVSKGVDGKPLDAVPLDVLKAHVSKSPEKHKSKRGRSKPPPPPRPKDIEASAHGLITRHPGLQAWIAVIRALCEAIEAGDVPAECLDKLVECLTANEVK